MYLTFTLISVRPRVPIPPSASLIRIFTFPCPSFCLSRPSFGLSSSFPLIFLYHHFSFFLPPFFILPSTFSRPSFYLFSSLFSPFLIYPFDIIYIQNKFHLPIRPFNLSFALTNSNLGLSITTVLAFYKSTNDLCNLC